MAVCFGRGRGVGLVKGGPGWFLDRAGLRRGAADQPLSFSIAGRIYSNAGPYIDKQTTRKENLRFLIIKIRSVQLG